jgi:hypothetical protein
MSSIELPAQSAHRKKVHGIIVQSQLKAGSRSGFRGPAETPVLVANVALG